MPRLAHFFFLSEIRDDFSAAEREMSKAPKKTPGRMYALPKLAHALAESDRAGGLPVWAEDKSGGTGEKVYYATPYRTFYESLYGVRSRDRHFYEILMPDRPTHLYLDVEYEKLHNPGLGDVSAKIDEIVRRGFAALYKVRDVELIELDASDDRKYSRHMIYRLRDGSMFKNPFHCGAFLRRFSFPECTNSKDKRTEVVDRAVYDKHRPFRVGGSTKVKAPDRPLMPLRPRNVSFLDTLVQRPARDEIADMLECCERDGSDPVSGRGPRPGSKRKRDDLPDASYEMPEHFLRTLGREIERFWDDGTVDLVNYDRERQVALFGSTSRWCGLLGGEHSSNHVFFVADLRRGAWRQACHNRSRDTCSELDRETNKRVSRWNDWRDFAHAEQVRDFVRRSTALQDEYLALLDRLKGK
jgi:hypothetical protein